MCWSMLWYTSHSSSSSSSSRERYPETERKCEMCDDKAYLGSRREVITYRQ
jgi:hypothetical protein